MNYSNQSDENLMLLYGEGNAAAFEELYGRHKGAVYRYVVRQVHDKELAHDLYQELWGKVIKAAASYSPTAKWTTWAYRIAHNLIVDHFRTFKLVEDEVESVSSNTPQKAHEQSELASQLASCMNKLPATQREIFLLSQETDLNLSMIAEVVSASHEAVKSRLRYARTALKECLSKFGVLSASGNAADKADKAERELGNI